MLDFFRAKNPSACETIVPPARDIPPAELGVSQIVPDLSPHKPDCIYYSKNGLIRELLFIISGDTIRVNYHENGELEKISINHKLFDGGTKELEKRYYNHP